jgi:hypothetical protein
LIAAAALSLTSPHWIEHHNQHVVTNLQALRQEADHINRVLGFGAVTVHPDTAAGRHTTVALHSRLFATPMRNGLDVCTILLHYGFGERASGIAMSPGELFAKFDSRAPDMTWTLRANLAVPADEFAEFLRRLNDVVPALRAEARSYE